MNDFILLCYGRNSPYSYDAHTPLSILSLGTYLERNGVEVEYFDERVESRRHFDALLRRKPLAVGCSVIGGYQIASSARLSRRARELSPESLIVWGGITPTLLARETAGEDFVDCAVRGEGEETLLDLYRLARQGRREFSPLLGVAYKSGGEILITPPRPTPDLESLPFPYEGKALGMLERYLEGSHVREAVGYEGSRGCPFLCGFCYSPNFHADTRIKSPAKIASELQRLKALGIKDLDVYDDTLLGGKKTGIAHFSETIAPLGMTWIGNLRINLLSRELLRSLEASGCRWLYFGIESGDDETLKKMQKGFTAAHIRDGLEIMKSSKIPAVYSLIIGLPLEGENVKIGRYLDFADGIHREHPASEVQVQSYVPLPGSEMYRNAIALGFTPPAKLLDWVDHDHLKISNPWLQDPSLANKIYLSTFLAYRYRRHLSGFPEKLVCYPLHRLSLWRLRRRIFGFYVEKFFYEAAMGLAKLWVGLRYFIQDRL